MASEDMGRIRARLTDGLINVKVIMRHPMETGAREHPDTGALLARHFIREVVCEHNGSPVLTLEWGWGVAADPYFSFDILDGNAGDRITVRWEDNQGAKGRLETEVS
jgi:sulfur-oxidizing protein SoxZ